jgi:hypothetical protein
MSAPWDLNRNPVRILCEQYLRILQQCLGADDMHRQQCSTVQRFFSISIHDVGNVGGLHARSQASH